MKTNLLRIGIITIILICSAFNLKASHLQSGYISYQYVDTNKYLVSVTLHRDCYGVPAPPFVKVCYSSVSAGINGTVDLYPIPGTGDTIPISTCNFQPGTCVNGVGIQEWIYNDTLILPQSATDWILSYRIHGFFGYTSFPPSTMDGYVTATLNNVDFPINSTSVFNNMVYYVYCINMYNAINYGCSDSDGDSLVYSLMGGLIGSDSCPSVTTPIIYYPPLSPTNPLSSSTPVTLNASTGLFEFTPNQLQVIPICIKIDEYRNGVLISSSTRDDIIVTSFSTINGINEAHKGFDPIITPNPFTSEFNIGIKDNEQVSFQLTDITGRTLIKMDFTHNATITSQDLTPGIYFYHVSDNKNNITSGKLTKQ